jgi:hypothetical protein
MVLTMGNTPSSTEWQSMLNVPRRPASTVARRDIPVGPGVYAWFISGDCVYLGKASTLRSRLAAHLGTSLDLSRSTLRSWVAVRELGLDRAYTRQRPTLMTSEQIAVVNDWIRACELAWVETDTNELATALESRMLSSWRPPINVA